MRKYLPSQKWRDLAIMIVVLIVVWIPASEMEAFEWLYNYSREHEDWELDEIILLVLLLPLPLAWYGVRRAREAARLARRSLENERDLAHARKIDSLGTLAGGLAHELNNQLQPVVGLAELLETQTADDDPRRKQVEMILAGSLRARDSVDKVLRFARREAASFKVTDTSEAMRALVDLMGMSCPSSVAMKTQIADGLPATSMPWNDVESVVMNLFSNAVSAMEGGQGTLTLTLEPSASDSPIGDKAAALLSVSDTGIGIPAKSLERIFEPYFTSKDVGEGTGLGLWQVQELLRSAGGAIEVSSEQGVGTEMRVWLPKAAPSAAA
ncbi:sensor histidine kinase [Thalassobius sp. MITS945101]|uniref:sensor histidine kinase n=1 Tax=Thalassobius sp. MITS945101 TaxID=3096994 RepID=UPI00399B163D